ncbi:unnamed protein product [Hermetia illucens]|uniref:HAUS augmin-like complex subunit 6 N-terminal domain-containing protein n=2 Tax=Hermetia illucens TaxID=343691 RepID=A0A7R8V3C8_HERIL|nr:unnamed protein product [Hermetia illucens]
MHYLFNILDAAEFKKKFHWPVDRTSESAFRTATVQYLNHLNEKHNLGWGEIKLFLVVMPGGMKFMKFLLELMNFVVEEEIRKTQKCLPEYLPQLELSLTSENVSTIVRTHEVFMEKALVLKENLSREITNLRKSSEALGDELNKICKDIGLSRDQLDDTFWEKFADSNKELFKATVVSQVNEIEETEKSLDKLSSEIDTFSNADHCLPYDKNLLISSYKTIQADYPDLCPKEDIVTTDNKIQLDSLFNAFNSVFPILKNLFEKSDLVNQTEKHEFELSQVSQMETDAVQLDGDISQCEMVVENLQSELEKDLAKSFYSEQLITDSPNREENCIRSKYISTPVIQVENDDKTPRLPLRGDNEEVQFYLTNSASLDTTSAGNASQIIDPITLLRTVTRSNSRNRQHRLNMSCVSTRDEAGTSCIKGRKSLPLTTNENEDLLKTPISSKQKELSAKKALDRRNAIKETFFANHYVPFDPDDTILQAEQETILNNDLMKSPSGRLDPLVKISPEFVVPRVCINDMPTGSFGDDDTVKDWESNGVSYDASF